MRPMRPLQCNEQTAHTYHERYFCTLHNRTGSVHESGERGEARRDEGLLRFASPRSARDLHSLASCLVHECLVSLARHEASEARRVASELASWPSLLQSELQYQELQLLQESQKL